MDSLSPLSQAISELFSTGSASAITFILKAIVYEERRAFGMMRKITVTKEILNWNVCQVTETESIVVFLQLRLSIHIFTDSLFFFFCVYSHSLAFVFIEPFPDFFPWGSLTQMAGYNQEFRFRLIADGFAFSFGQHKSVGRSLTFRVSAYRWRNTVVTTKVTYCNIVNST